MTFTKLALDVSPEHWSLSPTTWTNAHPVLHLPARARCGRHRMSLTTPQDYQGQPVGTLSWAYLHPNHPAYGCRVRPRPGVSY